MSLPLRLFDFYEMIWSRSMKMFNGLVFAHYLISISLSRQTEFYQSANNNNNSNLRKHQWTEMVKF